MRDLLWHGMKQGLASGNSGAEEVILDRKTNVV